VRRILLNQNESPYPPPVHVLEAARQELSKANRYPDPGLKEEVTQLAAEYMGVDPEQTILVPGADTIVDIISRPLGIQKYIIPDPSFYDIIIGTFDWNNVAYMKIPLKKYVSQLKPLSSREWRMVALVDNPNNPLGCIVFEEKPDTSVPIIVDEAYYEYSKLTMRDHVRKEENIIILRTFSKAFALASLRIGAIAAPTHIAEKLKQDPLVFRITSPSLKALRAALTDPSYVHKNVAKTLKEKERLVTSITRLGVKVYESHTNFITIDTGIPGITRTLAEKGIIVKSLENWIKPGLIRVTIGKKEENDIFLEELEKVLSQARTKDKLEAGDDRLRPEVDVEPCEA
jgi:histidinol-phosphate aminotransferase